MLARCPAAAALVFASNGGALAHIIGGMIDLTAHADDDGEFEHLDEVALPSARRCENDDNAAGVRVAALGADFPARFPDCRDCGCAPQSDAEEEEGEEDEDEEEESES